METNFNIDEGGLLWDDDGNELRDGDEVRVNHEFEGVISVTSPGEFAIKGWPEDQIIHSIEVLSSHLKP